MKNPFRISRKNLQALYADSMRRFSRTLFDEMLKNHGREAIERQITSKAGPMIDAINTHIKKLSAKTGNVEVIKALGLSDFYWPHTETEIAFELRSDIKPGGISSYEGLVKAFKGATHIDCEISGDGITRLFQIKRYPIAYLGDSNNSFLKWLDEVIQHYGNMRGIILAILIQPEVDYAQSQLHLHNLALSLASMKDQITFDEVVLTYNDKGQYFALHKLYPEEKRVLVPLDWGLRRFRGEV